MSKQIHEYLLGYGIKPSLQRVAVMHYLKTHFNHPTAEQIFMDLSPRMPTLSKMTVYNTLNLLAERGAILALNVDDKQTRFDGDITLHAHFICTCCHTIEDIRISDNDFIDTNAPLGAEISDVQLIYKGLCNRCKNKNNN